MPRSALASFEKIVAVVAVGLTFGLTPASAGGMRLDIGRRPGAVMTAVPAVESMPAMNFRLEHDIGQRFQIDPNDLPAPSDRSSGANPPSVIAYGGQKLSVPPGFVVTLFAKGLANPRRLLVLPNGDVLVAEQRTGSLTLLRGDGTGEAKWIGRPADGFDEPYGLAWRNGDVLVADQDGIWRVPFPAGLSRGESADVRRAGDAPAAPLPSGSAAGGKTMLTRTGVFGVVSGHQNRPIAIDPANNALFVGVGSVGNLDAEPTPKASIQRFDADGGRQMTYASGTRNPTALAFLPETGDLWALVQERDGMGDNLPSDYMIRVRKDGFYGWPYAYIGPHPQTWFAGRAPDKVKATITPDLLFQAHSSLLDFVFYEATQFPAEYKGSAFVALRGSWNRSMPTGYKIARVPFRDGRPMGYYENFVTGFWASGEARAQVWGRPAAVAVAQDGSLLIADDTGGTIWRVSYTGAR